MSEQHRNDTDQGLERVTDAARYLSVSRSMVYKLINAGVLPSVKIGSSRRIPIRAVRELASGWSAFTAKCDER